MFLSALTEMLGAGSVSDYRFCSKLWLFADFNSRMSQVQDSQVRHVQTCNFFWDSYLWSESFRTWSSCVLIEVSVQSPDSYPTTPTLRPWRQSCPAVPRLAGFRMYAVTRQLVTTEGKGQAPCVFSSVHPSCLLLAWRNWVLNRFSLTTFSHGQDNSFCNSWLFISRGSCTDMYT